MKKQSRQLNDKASRDSRRRNSLRIAAILLVALAVFDVFSTINYVSQPSQILLFAMLLSYAATVASSVSFRLIWKGSVSVGVWVLILTNLIALFLSPFLGSGLGLIYGITATVVTAIVSWQGLEGRQHSRANIVGVGFGVIIYALDRTLMADGVAGSNVDNSITLIILTVLLLVLIVSVARQFANYNLRNKLLTAFGALSILTLALGVVMYLGVSAVRSAYELALSSGEKMKTASLHVRGDLATARQLESEFLLRWQEEGFDAAYEKYVVPHEEAVAEIKEHFEELSAFGAAVGQDLRETYTQKQYELDLIVLTRSVTLYEQNFQKTVRLIEDKGFKDTGLEGEIREAVHDIDSRIYGREGLEELVITMLQIRRREKDYLLRGEQQYIDDVRQLVSELKQQIAASDQLDSNEKRELQGLAEEYIVAFNALVRKDVEIASTIDIFTGAAQTMEPLADKVAGTGAELSALNIASARAGYSRTVFYSSLTLAVILIAALAVSVTLSRQITYPVRLLTSTASEIAKGKFDLRAEVTTSDEIGTLAQTFNLMTSQLGRAFADVRRHAADLATVADVSAATSTILDVNRLLQKVVDLTRERFDLYHSHIYLVDEEGKNLVLASGAGEPGRVMVAEGHSIPLEREQSLVARVARERKGVTVNDVTQAPDFLPNPLLPHTRSELAVPMIAGGEVIGVFDIQSEEVGRFTESDVNVQTTLAAQLATSVQNVRSFEQSRRQAEFEAQVNLISQSIQRATTIEETLQIAIRELGTAAGASRVKASISANQDGIKN